MEEILRIIYDCSKKGKIISVNEMEKLLALLIAKNKLEDYILNFTFKDKKDNNLGSYYYPDRKITLYSNTITEMISKIRNNIKLHDIFTINLYSNLRILQVILHEIEHANQEKIITNANTLEGLILKISRYANIDKRNYEFNPEERYAEIKSFISLYEIIKCLDNKPLLKMINCDKHERQLRGYHYKNGVVYCPIIEYYKYTNLEKFLQIFPWYSNDFNGSLEKVMRLYSLEERLFYGFFISCNEYYFEMNNLISEINVFYKNKINILK